MREGRVSPCWPGPCFVMRARRHGECGDRLLLKPLDILESFPLGEVDVGGDLLLDAPASSSVAGRASSSAH